MELLKESFFNDEVELKDDDFNQEEVPESKGTYSEVILLDFCWYMTKIEDFKIPLLNKAICLFTNSDYIESYRITIQAFGSYKDYTSEKNIIYEKVISSVSSLKDFYGFIESRQAERGEPIVRFMFQFNKSGRMPFHRLCIGFTNIVKCIISSYSGHINHLKQKEQLFGYGALYGVYVNGEKFFNIIATGKAWHMLPIGEYLMYSIREFGKIY